MPPKKSKRDRLLEPFRSIFRPRSPTPSTLGPDERAASASGHALGTSVAGLTSIPSEQDPTIPEPSPGGEAPAKQAGHMGAHRLAGASSGDAEVDSLHRASMAGTSQALKPLKVAATSVNANSSSAVTEPAQRLEPRLTDTGIKDSAVAILKASLTGLRKSMGVVPTLQSATDILFGCIDSIPSAIQNRGDYKNLASDITIAVNSFDGYLEHVGPTPMTKAVENVISELTDVAKHIQTQQQRTGAKPYIEADRDIEDIVRCYRRVEALFRQLQSDVTLSVWKMTNENLNTTTSSHVNALLRELDQVKDARYDSSAASQVRRGGCTPNTRRTILQELRGWAADSNGAKVYWMNGMAGTGKTTIAYSLCSQLEEAHQLAASFFCSRSLPACRDIGRVIPTIVYQLARLCHPFRDSLCQALEKDPDLGGRVVATQLQRLLSEPMQKVKDKMPAGLLVVVIDALDECTNQQDATLVLDALLHFADTLPIKFFVTCRPDSELLRTISNSGSLSRSLYHLHDIEESLVQADIETYLRAELEPICARGQIERIAKQSGRLFIYAATVVKYIGTKNPMADRQERLEVMLDRNSGSSGKAYQPLDALYTAILASALENDQLELRETERIRMSLHTVIYAIEPLTVGALASMLHMKNNEQCRRSVEALWSVLHIHEHTGLVSTLHASFPDYMSTKTRSGRFFYDQTKHHEFLARRCFETMSHMLRFNICNFESSFLLDKDVSNLSTRVGEAIPLHLFYACRYWADHMLPAEGTNGLRALLGEFLLRHVLFWMEVMNVKNATGAAVSMLSGCQSWMKTVSMSDDLRELCSDAQKFVAIVGANSVCKSTPHIYVSVLGLWDKRAPIWIHYGAQTRGMVVAEGPAIENRESAALAVWRYTSVIDRLAVSSDGRRVVSSSREGYLCVWDAHSGDILMRVPTEQGISPYCVAFSPDGTCFASGGSNGNFYIWDVLTGRKAMGPFQGHTGPVMSVAYSPDGSRLASGSEDKTILIWSALTGDVVAGPFKGHSGTVISVAYSPDGKHIASGSHDSTICIWDAQTGRKLVGPITGHTRGVNSVAYSPDGGRLASGSDDQTVHIWDARTGDSLVTPFHGHTKAVECVSYSPDGDRIASGSSDCTVRVWDARDGQTIAGPFSGHTVFVCSVVFMPDGTRVVSCSHDQTIRIWDAKALHASATTSEGHKELVSSLALSRDGRYLVSGSYYATICIWDTATGKMTAGPLAGHRGIVSSVAFSPCGNCVASGSDDHTVRIWDVGTGHLLVGPCKGHSHNVLSVAFSPDGSRVASGSLDCTIRVWDAQSGHAVLPAFTGHTSVVWSVAYSPDGERIASCTYDGTIRIWDAQTGEAVAGPFHHNARSVTYSSDGTRILFHSDETVSIRDTLTAVVTTGAREGHTGQVNSVALSSDDRYIISGSSDRTIRVWDAHTGQMIAGPLHAHNTEVRSVACSPNGHLMASSSEDGMIRIWDLNKLMSTLPNDLSWWTMNEDGWVTGHDSSLLLWVPPDLRTGLKWPQNPAVMNQKGGWELDFTNAYIGTEWTKCYISQ